MKFNDISWDDIILEAEDTPEEDTLSATDYNEAEDMEIEEAGEKDLSPSNYSEEETEEDSTDENLDEEPIEGEEQSDELDSTGDESLDDNPESDSIETPEEEQTVNEEENINGQQNKYLIQDFIELHTRIDEILDKLRSDKKLNSFVNPTYTQVKKNLVKLKDVTYDYITDKFIKATYVSNLYQFNLIIQALNINVQLLENSLKKMNGGKNNKKKTKK